MKKNQGAKNGSAQNGGAQSHTPAEQADHGMLETTAQAIGSTLGNLAVKTGLAKPLAGVDHPQPALTNQPAHQHPNRKARRAKKKK